MPPSSSGADELRSSSILDLDFVEDRDLGHSYVLGLHHKVIEETLGIGL